MPRDTLLEEESGRRVAPPEATRIETQAPEAGRRVAPPEATRIETHTDDDLRSLEAGLDRLQTTPERRASAWRRFTTSVLPPVLFIVFLLVVWQLYIVIAQPRPDIVPAPIDVVNA
ncbi:MAG TPA: hypothetical protein VFR16_11745, partial [Agromyces mariniharenae]|nr:hypothetical protein [Agromyces mariniharenae]